MLFDQIEHALPTIRSTDEIALICRLLVGLLHDHGSAETDLAYIALDHILHHQDRLTRLHHDHAELDGLLHEVTAIRDLPQARARLLAALTANRAHFDQEERTVFPLLQQALQPETLAVLGKVWKKHTYRQRA